jgi:cell wall-associated NlpC family hydrolase
VERRAEPSSHPFAPARNNARSATVPGSNSFDSLANETTRAVRVSPELLGQVREDQGGGATKAYEVPPELLVLARASKEKKAAARRAREGSAAELNAARAEALESQSAEASARITARPPASERAPSVIVAEEDLAPASAVLSEQPQSAVVAAAPKAAPAPKAVSAPAPARQALKTPAVAGGHGGRRAARWLLIAACAIAVCAGGVLGGKLLRDRQLLTIPAIGLHF